MPEKPIIVCLCGSARFWLAFDIINKQETLAGKIVLSMSCNLKEDKYLFGYADAEGIENIKIRLDELHLRKIDLADEVLIINIGGYIGESTKKEIAYAIKHNKKIRWLEKPV